MKLKIGIPAWKIGESIGVKTDYLHFISNRLEGEPVIIMPTSPEIIDDLDLLILPGGADISPGSYGAIPGLYTQNSNPLLEYFDAKLLGRYFNNGTPILGICRGAQKLWTLYGGELVQHYREHKQSAYETDEVHKLEFTDGFKYARTLVNKVTSRHHQMMVGERPALEVIAYAESDKCAGRKIVEVFKHRELPIVGVQYHPESNSHDDELTVHLVDNILLGR